MLDYDSNHNSKVEQFFAEFTPIWFNILGWVALLAGIQVLNSKSENLFISGILGFLLVSLLFYFFALFSRFRLLAPEGASRKHQITLGLVSILVTSTLGCGSYYIAHWGIDLLTVISKP